MSDTLQMARACGRALVAAARRADRVAQVAADLAEAVRRLETSAPFRRLVSRRAHLPPAARRQCVAGALAGIAGPEIRHLLARMADWNQLHLLPDLVREFDRARLRLEGRCQARLVFARPPSAGDLELLRGRLDRACGGRLDLEVRTDPALLGGLTLQMDDRLMDASLSGRLARLRRGLDQGAPAPMSERNPA